MNHLQIAHYLGLYYEGILTQIPITNLQDGILDNLSHDFKLHPDDPYHTFNYNNVKYRYYFDDDSLPLPLNFIILDNRDVLPNYYKRIFYNIKNNKSNNERIIHKINKN